MTIPRQIVGQARESEVCWDFSRVARRASPLLFGAGCALFHEARRQGLDSSAIGTRPIEKRYAFCGCSRLSVHAVNFSFQPIGQLRYLAYWALTAFLFDLFVLRIEKNALIAPRARETM